MNNLDDLSEKISAPQGRGEEDGDSDMVFVEDALRRRASRYYSGGGTEHVVDEVKRAFEDAIGVVAVAHEDGSVLTGGGSVIAAQSRPQIVCRGNRRREQMAMRLSQCSGGHPADSRGERRTRQ